MLRQQDCIERIPKTSFLQWPKRTLSYRAWSQLDCKLSAVFMTGFFLDIGIAQFSSHRGAMTANLQIVILFHWSDLWKRQQSLALQVDVLCETFQRRLEMKRCCAWHLKYACNSSSAAGRLQYYLEASAIFDACGCWVDWDQNYSRKEIKSFRHCASKFASTTSSITLLLCRKVFQHNILPFALGKSDFDIAWHTVA